MQGCIFFPILNTLLMISSGYCLSLTVRGITEGSSGHAMPNYKQVPAPGAGIPHYIQAWPRCFVCLFVLCVYDRTCDRTDVPLTCYLSVSSLLGRKYEKHHSLCAVNRLWVGVGSIAEKKSHDP